MKFKLLMLTDSTFVAGQRWLLHLVDGASQRVKAAFRPKTRRCYQLLFRNFVGFCCLADILIQDVSLHSVMAYLEYLALNKVSVHMVANNVAAIKANFVMYGIDHSVMAHPRVKYFLKSMRINRPLSVPVRNVMSLQNLVDIVHLCDNILFGSVFKAVFLIAFFGFLRISNIAPHSIASFDPTRHLTPSDVKISKNFMTLAIKWSKTNQNRDKIHYITLPILRSHPLCPVSALKNALSLYSPSPLDPLFQIRTVSGWTVLTDSRIRKVLSRLNKKMGLCANYFTFHSFRRSGATLAFDAHVPLQSIKSHGSWTSDCVWTYIQQNKSSTRDIALSLARVINNA